MTATATATATGAMATVGAAIGQTEPDQDLDITTEALLPERDAPIQGGICKLQ